eukprot:CAMPEP_0202884568 /NCGR_PEP_ID=MMETSP1391-20130828/41147_1 /ASSEMBLY_ACC=CAM_ASM_000867 /TAXON_ID=1034604 /ORGANISM="Chlamydomonas leiostraca, Strain SAG 11-49" /LENGTH=161 /DNA_ID=CAMNT_0049567783 /DNA_START=145 /DNA_END=627 /DNA_ORIENTATION=+
MAAAEVEEGHIQNLVRGILQRYEGSKNGLECAVSAYGAEVALALASNAREMPCGAENALLAGMGDGLVAMSGELAAAAALSVASDNRKRMVEVVEHQARERGGWWQGLVARGMAAQGAVWQPPPRPAPVTVEDVPQGGLSDRHPCKSGESEGWAPAMDSRL